MHYLAPLLLAVSTSAVSVPQSHPTVPIAGESVSDEVVVTGQRISELDLARLIKAQATFDRNRMSLAPQATLYFEVSGSHGLVLEGLRLRLRVGDRTLDVPLDTEHRFTLPPVTDKHARLLHNRGAGQIALRPLVLSSGASEASRPLGDLRLQCRVARALNGNEMSFRERLIFDVMGACSSPRVALHFYSPHPLVNAQVTTPAGPRPLTVDWHGRRYLVPASDRTLANTARVTLTYR